MTENERGERPDDVVSVVSITITSPPFMGIDDWSVNPNSEAYPGSLVQQLKDGFVNAFKKPVIAKDDILPCKVGNTTVTGVISKVTPIDTMFYKYDPKYSMVDFLGVTMIEKENQNPSSSNVDTAKGDLEGKPGLTLSSGGSKDNHTVPSRETRHDFLQQNTTKTDSDHGHRSKIGFHQ
jgi:hypothetical protein